jgi:hypothetical protein
MHWSDWLVGRQEEVFYEHEPLILCSVPVILMKAEAEAGDEHFRLCHSVVPLSFYYSISDHFSRNGRGGNTA